MPEVHLKIMIVAGEASGDLHAAKLVQAIRECSPGRRIDFFGSAGPKMREAGVEAIIDSDRLSIVGVPEIATALPMFLRAYRLLKRSAFQRKPDLAILVDFPDFNLKLAKSLKRLGIRVVYYISPQVWAWRSYRIRTIRRCVDLMITILPFEKAWYASKGFRNVEYVGSPLAREVQASRSKQEFCAIYGIDLAKPIISLLPGSRHKEIVRILPIMIEATAMLAEKLDGLQCVIALASETSLSDTRKILDTDKRGPRDNIFLVVGETFNALNASDAAAVTSGTATLETAIIGTPMAIVYKTSALNYRLLRPLITVDHFGLINLIAGERVANEMIQGDLTPRALADEIARLLDSTENRRMRQKLKVAADKLGRGGASVRAAELILKLMDPTKNN